MDTNETPMIKVVDLHKKFGSLEVLKGVDLKIPRGNVIVLIGASGSGKSTLIRCIHHLIPYEKGEIYIDGERIGYHTDQNGRLVKDTGKVLRKKQAKLGFVFQHFNLFSNMTALENVSLGPQFVLGLNKEDARKLASEKLAQLGLKDKAQSYPSQLSGGQQQRVGIARALAMEPKVIMFDEPTSALDPELVMEILEVIKALAIQGMTMIVVTHEIHFACDVGSEMVFLHQGKIIEKAPPREMVQNPQNSITADFLRRVNI
jgi:polar amino acid transport system ATP-binding protein